jgi:hypothetical protein
MMSLTPRRWVFWALLAIAGIAALALKVPALQYVTIQGKPFGGTAYPYAALTTAFASLLLWSAFYVRVEPLLVRIALLVFGLPLLCGAVGQLWQLIRFSVTGSP